MVFSKHVNGTGQIIYDIFLNKFAIDLEISQGEARKSPLKQVLRFPFLTKPLINKMFIIQSNQKRQPQ